MKAERENRVNVVRNYLQVFLLTKIYSLFIFIVNHLFSTLQIYDAGFYVSKTRSDSHERVQRERGGGGGGVPN